MKKKINKIPEFKSLEEEAEFWDTHSFTDYWDELEDVQLEVKLKPEEMIEVPMQRDALKELEAVAKKKGVSVSTLARMLILKNLKQQAYK